MRDLTIGFFAAVAAVFVCGAAPDASLLWYDKPAEKWTDALPVGNGQMGAMVFGGVGNERVQFNEYTFWTGRPHSYVHEGAADALQEIRQLVAEGKKREAAALVDRTFLAVPKLEAAYQPCGDLFVKLEGVEGHSNYRRELDLSSGVARSEFSSGVAPKLPRGSAFAAVARFSMSACAPLASQSRMRLTRLARGGRVCETL